VHVFKATREACTGSFPSFDHHHHYQIEDQIQVGRRERGKEMGGKYAGVYII
jgi:hypothetical protein